MKYDFIILGGGAAGFSSALKADELGVKTLMVNSGNIGGTCVNVGCVPSKYLLTALELRHRALNHHYGGMEFKEEKFDYSRLIESKDKLIKVLRKKKYQDVIDSMDGVDYIQGRGVFLSNKAIKVNGEIYEGDKILIATGSRTRILPIEGLESVKDKTLTNIEALDLKSPPDSIIILGGRAQALEFAQIFARAGSVVDVIQRSDRIMPQTEPELSYALKNILEGEGVRIHTGSTIKRMERSSDGVRLHFSSGDEEKVIEADYVLFATGRVGNTDEMGLENTDVTVERSFIVTDGMLRAGRNIFAAGDVTGEPMLETVAAREGAVAGINALTNQKIEMDYSAVPKVVFTDPQLADVGMSDLEANRQFTCSCRTVLISNLPKAMITGDTEGMIKIVTDRETSRILGVHILSAHAGEMIHEAMMILKNSMTVDDVIQSVHAFPTMSEAIKLGAISFRKDIDRLPCCAE